MERVQKDEEDFLSLEFARRLQHEYDSEMTPERSLAEEQRAAYAESLQKDQLKRKRKKQPEVKAAKAAPPEVKAAKAAAKAEVKAAKAEVEKEKEALVMDPMTNDKPTLKELRELRIKALGNLSA